MIASGAATGDRTTLAYPAPDGGSFFLPANGAPARIRASRALDDLFEALALGVKSYYEKTGAFRSLGIALSGGRDSMLTLLVAWRARPADHRRAAARIARVLHAEPPLAGLHARSRGSSLAARAGVTLHMVPIDEATDREVEVATRMLGGAAAHRLTRQNIQARLRGQRMWNWANSSGALFLQTGDMSEKAVGYTTIGGDLEGALSVIANVPKTVVVALLSGCTPASASAASPRRLPPNRARNWPTRRKPNAS